MRTKVAFLKVPYRVIVLSLSVSLLFFPSHLVCMNASTKKGPNVGHFRVSESPLNHPSIFPPQTPIPKAAKIFGRISSPYILLDSTGGSCCYSGCTDCAYRDPEGGYKMSEMTAARPKWVVCYSSRVVGTVQGLKTHNSIFNDSVWGEGKVRRRKGGRGGRKQEI